MSDAALAVAALVLAPSAVVLALAIIRGYHVLLWRGDRHPFHPRDTPTRDQDSESDRAGG